MSAFLGPIHYWLYNKIKHVVSREQKLYEAAAEQCGSLAEELREQVWQSYGSPLEDKDLGELIDSSNIHGWLQRQINIAETREAAFITELVNNCGAGGSELARRAFLEHGKLCGGKAREEGSYDTSRADSIYKALNDFYLNGMPCDQADMVKESTPEKVIWEVKGCLQEPNWKRAGADQKLMKALYENWLTGFVTAINPEFEYKHTTGTADRHEIVRK